MNMTEHGGHFGEPGRMREKRLKRREGGPTVRSILKILTPVRAGQHRPTVMCGSFRTDGAMPAEHVAA